MVTVVEKKVTRIWEFSNTNFRCTNPGKRPIGTDLILHDAGSDYRLSIGAKSSAQIGMGVQYSMLSSMLCK